MTPMRVKYFESYTDDFVESRHQDMQLPADYDWREKYPRCSQVFAAVVRALAKVVYPLFFNGHVFGSSKVAHSGTGCYVFANHTQPGGDVFLPFLVGGGRRVHPIVAPANLGVPVAGKLLRPAGALILPGTDRKSTRLNSSH